MSTPNDEVVRLREALLSAALDFHGAEGGNFGPFRGWWGRHLAERADLYGRAVRRAENEANAVSDTIPAPPPVMDEEEEESVYDARAAAEASR